MELSPHPNDIRARSLHVTVPWQLVILIVKDAYLAEVVIRDSRCTELVFPKVTPQADQPALEMLKV